MSNKLINLIAVAHEIIQMTPAILTAAGTPSTTIQVVTDVAAIVPNLEEDILKFINALHNRHNSEVAGISPSNANAATPVQNS